MRERRTISVLSVIFVQEKEKIIQAKGNPVPTLQPMDRTVRIHALALPTGATIRQISRPMLHLMKL